MIPLSPFDINFQEGFFWILSWWVWSLGRRTKQQVGWDANRGQDSLSGTGSRRMQRQVARCLSFSEIGDTKLYGSVIPRGFGWTESIILVRPSSSQRKHLSPQLTRQVRSHKDLQGIRCRECWTKRNQKRNLDEIFFERGNKYAWDICKSIEKNARELHLEMVSDNVTYVRVYWLRSQVRSLDHRSYSSFKLKMGLPFFV